MDCFSLLETFLLFTSAYTISIQLAEYLWYRTFAIIQRKIRWVQEKYSAFQRTPREHQKFLEVIFNLTKYTAPFKTVDISAADFPEFGISRIQSEASDSNIFMTFYLLVSDYCNFQHSSETVHCDVLCTRQVAQAKTNPMQATLRNLTMHLNLIRTNHKLKIKAHTHTHTSFLFLFFCLLHVVICLEILCFVPVIVTL